MHTLETAQNGLLLYTLFFPPFFAVKEREIGERETHTERDRLELFFGELILVFFKKIS